MPSRIPIWSIPCFSLKIPPEILQGFRYEWKGPRNLFSDSNRYYLKDPSVIYSGILFTRKLLLDYSSKTYKKTVSKYFEVSSVRMFQDFFSR